MEAVLDDEGACGKDDCKRSQSYYLLGWAMSFQRTRDPDEFGDAGISNNLAKHLKTCRVCGLVRQFFFGSPLVIGKSIKPQRG